MDEMGRSDLEMLVDEVLGDPDAWLQSERLIALLGKADVEQLVNEAKDTLALAKGAPDEYETSARLLMERVQQDPARAERFAKAYDTLEHEAVKREVDEEQDARQLRAHVRLLLGIARSDDWEGITPDKLLAALATIPGLLPEDHGQLAVALANPHQRWTEVTHSRILDRLQNVPVMTIEEWTEVAEQANVHP